MFISPRNLFLWYGLISSLHLDRTTHGQDNNGNGGKTTLDIDARVSKKMQPFMKILNKNENLPLKEGIEVALEMLARDNVEKDDIIKQKEQEKIDIIKQKDQEKIDIIKQKDQEKIDIIEQKQQEKLDLTVKLENEKKEKLKEKRQKLEMVAYLDFGEIINKFLRECYPEWAGTRKNNDYSDDVWQKTFLNVNHPRVVALKKMLSKNKISEKDYIDIVNSLIVERNKEAHPKLSKQERDIAYHNFTQRFDNDTELVINVAFAVIQMNLMGIKKPTDENGAEATNDRLLEQQIISTTNEKLEPFKLLRIPKFGPLSYHTEAELETIFNDFAEEKDFEKPVAFYLDNNGAYILFNSHDHAMQFFTFRNETEYLLSDEVESMFLANVKYEMPWFNRCKLEIKLNDPHTLDDLKVKKDDLKNMVSHVKMIPVGLKTTPSPLKI